MSSAFCFISQDTDLVRHFKDLQKNSGTEGEPVPLAVGRKGACPFVVVDLEGNFDQAVQKLKAALEPQQKKEFYAIIAGAPRLKETVVQIGNIARCLSVHAVDEADRGSAGLPSLREGESPEPSLLQILEARLSNFISKMKRGRSKDVYHLLISECERAILSAALREVGGHQTRAAELLGLNRNTLHRKVMDFKIEVKKQSTREG